MQTYVKIGVKKFTEYNELYMLKSELETFKALNPSMQIMFEHEFEYNEKDMSNHEDYWKSK